MASIMLKAALLLFLALFTASNAQDFPRYTTDRSQLGKVSDGVSVNVRALKAYLENVNFTNSTMRSIGRIATKIQVFKEEQLPRHSPGILLNHYRLILNTLVDDICHLFKIAHIVEETSTCSLPEMKRLMTLLDMHSNSLSLYTKNERIRSAVGYNSPQCYCPWYNYKVLGDDCSSSGLGLDILHLDHKCRFCSDPNSLSTSITTCACAENPNGAGC